MAWTTLAVAAAALIGVSGSKIDPPPVILDLGRLQPTPAPTPQVSNKKRLITVITVRNNAEGESVITFEATDVATDGKRKIRVLAAKAYAIPDDEDLKKPGVKELNDKMLRQVRALERDMLDYAEKAGPPKQVSPVPADAAVDKRPE